jgi:hypothetical protein
MLTDFQSKMIPNNINFKTNNGLIAFIIGVSFVKEHH